MWACSLGILWLMPLTLVPPQTSAGAEPEMRLRLKDGSYAAGQLFGSGHDHRLAWQSGAFLQPFDFDIQAMRSITRALSAEEEDEEEPSDGAAIQFVELADGAVVAGRLLAIDDQWLTIETRHLGRVQIERSAALALSDAGYAGQIVYSGPVDDDRWRPLSSDDDWSYEAGALVATKSGATIVGNVELPAKSQINLSLSWRGPPDFVFSFGTLASNLVSKVEEVPSAARLEVWADQLALVREVDGLADIAMLSELNSVNPRFDLSIYLDQETGTVVVCDTHGRPLESLQVEGKNTIVRPSVHLANSGPSLTIERFEVRQWDGVAASVTDAAGRGVLMESGQRLQGYITGFDADSGQLRITLDDGQQQQLPLAELRRGDLAHAAAQLASSAPQADHNQASSDEALPPPVVQPPQLDPQAVDASVPEISALDADTIASVPLLADGPEVQDNSPGSVELVLLDRTRLKGDCLHSDDPTRLQFRSLGLREQVQVPIAALRGMIGSSGRYHSPASDHPLGTLKSGEEQLAGYLEPSEMDADSEQEIETTLTWHPLGSVTASALNPQTSGSIVYRKPLPQLVIGVPGVGNLERIQRPVIAPGIGMFLGRLGGAAKPAADAADQPGEPNGQQSSPPAGSGEILFRSGDAIDGIAQQIDESGMTFRSDQTTTHFVPHDMIQHVQLNPMRAATDVSPEKLKRLMTVPRSMKRDPPTHLFIAVNGDHLRGRLVGLQGDKLTVEIRLEMVELDRSTIAQIVWLHDRQWSDQTNSAQVAATDEPEHENDSTTDSESAPNPVAEKAATVADQPSEQLGKTEASPEFQVHAIGQTDRGLTFRPIALRDGVLSGQSDLLGECSIAINDLNQLLFGRDVSQQVRAYRDDPWTLSLAQLPQVYLEGGGQTASSIGGASPLIGHPAVDFTLKDLAGNSFRLSQQRDRIVVLDFWASWCGPCVQTMPLVEAVVDELGVDKINLVAVNIQESSSRAQAAVERLEIAATVLLDSDGQTAAAYAANAIPQTVIIDRSGTVTHVFVGGGPKFIAQFRTALETAIAPQQQ